MAEYAPRVCRICGKLFVPKHNRRSTCYDKHFHKCPICGADVETIDLWHQNTCCCSEHSRLLAARTTKENFPDGVQTPEVQEKRRNTCLQKYGVENVMFVDAVREKQQESMKSAITPDVVAKRKQTCLERYGVEVISQDKGFTDKNKLRIKEAMSNPEVKEREQATSFEHWGVRNPMQHPEVQRRQSSSKKTSFVISDSVTLDSTYEKQVWDFCIDAGIPIQRNPVWYKFMYDGKEHTTSIDFQIDNILCEVKGEHLLRDLYSFDPSGVPISAKLDLYRQNHVVVITKISSNHDVSNVFLNGLQGIDLSLFQHQEEFPDDHEKWQLIKVALKECVAFVDLNTILSLSESL